MIVNVCMNKGGLIEDGVAHKLVSFGTDGALVFQGTRNGVTTQLITKHAPFTMGVYDMAHRTNLAMMALNGLPMVKNLEILYSTLYSYFRHSPKRHLEFIKLVEVVETSGLKILANVKTRWIMLEPLKRVLSEYKTLIVKMNEDSVEGSSRDSKATYNLSLLCDVHTCLALPCILPLLESMSSLIKFAQSPNAFLSDCVAVVKICQAEIYEMYVDTTTSFQPKHFQLFFDIIGDHSHCLSQEWVTDLNIGVVSLAFRIVGHTYAVHQVSLAPATLNEKLSVCKEDFAIAIASMKGQCCAAAELLIQEPTRRFPDSKLMEALVVVFPQYWLQGNCDDLFPWHLAIIKHQYCRSKFVTMGGGDNAITREITQPLDGYKLDLQTSLFKITMKANLAKCMEPPFDRNLATKLWQKLGCNALFLNKLSEFMKLSEIAITTVLGSVEDERTFSNLGFIKNRVKNHLDDHLETTLKLFS